MEVRAGLDAVADAEGAAPRIRKLLGEAPAGRAAPGLREWADVCSLLALEVHLGTEAASDTGPETVRRCREAGPDGAAPLPAGELRRQIRILELLAETADASAAGAGRFGGGPAGAARGGLAAGARAGLRPPAPGRGGFRGEGGW
ncbi:hypothetical protein [Streptomyces sp. NPDC048295]|uniref:hypothetical protein n=1 Tax=Streptomyces sp. NPDC048295 TaxID=3154617 RepID=UPI003419BB7A